MDSTVMLLAMAAVNVVLDGRLLLSSRPAMLDRGMVFAPLDPFVFRLADRVVVDMAHRTLRIERGDRIVTIPIAPYVREEQIVIPLALVARALGEKVTYEGWRATLSILSSSPAPVATMAPYVWPSPFVSPQAVFTPMSAPTPLPVVTGIPQPRRTPIWVPGASCCAQPLQSPR